jgi:hypothetical protein
MTKRRDANVEFDVDAAIAALHREALAAGAVPDGDSRATSPHLTALAHLHGLEPPTCNQLPCRTAGLCLALCELLQYQAETRDLRPLLDASDRSREASAWMAKNGLRYAEALETLVNHGHERNRAAVELGTAAPAHEHDLLCVRPDNIIQSLAALNESLGRFDEDLRGLVRSREVQQGGTGKRSGLLLRAVHQHLRWGGFPYAEIAALVPDGHGARDAAERARTRVRSACARWIFPRELEPRLASRARGTESLHHDAG